MDLDWQLQPASILQWLPLSVFTTSYSGKTKMHPNPAFRKTTEDKNIEIARARSFGVLAINAENGPLVSHIPFQLSENGGYLEAHLIRSNPIVRLLKEPVRAIMAVSGGDAYNLAGLVRRR